MFIVTIVFIIPNLILSKYTYAIDNIVFNTD